MSADGKTLKLAMEQLISDGFLVPAGETRFRVSDSVDRWLRVLCKAEETLVTEGDEGEKQTRIIYRCGKESVGINMDPRREGWIRIEVMTDI